MLPSPHRPAPLSLGWMGHARGGANRPGCCLNILRDDRWALWPLPHVCHVSLDDVQCSAPHLPTSQSCSSPHHPVQELFPHPGTWRGLKARTNNGLNIVGGSRATAAGCICPGLCDEEEACTCPAASLSAGNKSNKSPSVHPQVIL